MRKDSRLSRALHVLVHLNDADKPVTSETIAEMLSTNPVVVRRMLGLLRDQDYVASTKGHNGGWTLAKPLGSITLLDIHNAFSDTSIFTVGLTDEHTNCPIEIAVNNALKEVMDEAESLMLKRFGDIHLSVLEEAFR